MDMILIAGLWLDSSAWDEVTAELEKLGHRPVPVALPGADDRSTTATLDDQIAAVLTAVDAASRPMVVGHSAACSLAWIAADRRPEAVSRVVLIGGFPTGDGNAYADFFEANDGLVPFPGWEPFEGPDSADLDDAAKERFTASAIPVTEGVAKGIVRLSDDRRYDVPVTMVCPEYTPEQAKEWAASGDIPEVAATKDVSYVDIDSGHWPMITKAAELARLLHEAAAGT